MNMRTNIISALALFAASAAHVTALAEYPDRWVHVRNDLASDEKLDRFGWVVARAAECGFNGIMWDAGVGGEGVDFDGWKGARRERLEKAKRMCREKGMEIIPMLWSVGRAHALVNYDPTLAEGLPVRGVPFVSESGRAVYDGGREESAAVPLGDFASPVTLDAKGKRYAKTRFKVKPYRRYHVDMRVRVKGFSRVSGEGANKVTVRSSLSVTVSPLRGGKSLGSRESMPLRRFDDGAARMTFDFVTGDAEEAVLGAGIPARATQGSVTVERVAIREVGVRRPVVRAGAPFIVRNADTGETYREGIDYLAPKSDASVTRANDSDVAIAIPGGSAIRPGTRLAVDCYEVARRGNRQVGACMANPGLYAYFEKSAPVIDELFDHPRKWFLSMDEIRAGGTCEACAKSGKDLAHLLAQCLERQRDAIRKVNPDAMVYAWCDMYDPFVNAKPANRDKDYALCKGGFASDGFIAPKDIVAVVWGGEESAAKSLAYFAGHGVPTLYGTFYDVYSAEHFRVRGATDTINKVPGCRGLMYTTWVSGGKYDLLDKFGEFMKANSHPMPTSGK
jgi:hypothetical protein